MRPRYQRWVNTLCGLVFVVSSGLTGCNSADGPENGKGRLRIAITADTALTLVSKLAKDQCSSAIAKQSIGPFPFSGRECTFDYSTLGIDTVRIDPLPNTGGTWQWTGCQTVVGAQCIVKIAGVVSDSIQFTLWHETPVTIVAQGNRAAGFKILTNVLAAGTPVTIAVGDSLRLQPLLFSKLTFASPLDTGFTSWSGPCESGTGKPFECVLNVPRDSVRIVVTYAVPATIQVSGGGGTGSGSVASTPAGINCTIVNGAAQGSCSAPFKYGVNVTLTATPTTGQLFSGWSGDCTGATLTCAFVANPDRSIVANFVPRFVLAVNGSGSGTGTVSSGSSDINCTLSAGSATGTCASTYSTATPVTLTATPAKGAAFGGWSGACTGTGNCSVTVDQVRTVTADFQALPDLAIASMVATPTAGRPADPVVVTTVIQNLGSALAPATTTIVQLSPNGTAVSAGDPTVLQLNVPALNAGAQVTLVAQFMLPTVAVGNYFLWGTVDPAAAVTQSDRGNDRQVTPFTIVSGGFTVSVAGTTGFIPGSGVVTSTPAGIACTIFQGQAAAGTCAATFNPGATVSLAATAANGSAFNLWSGGCVGSGGCTMAALSANKSVTADFATSNTFSLTMATTAAGANATVNATATGPTNAAVLIACTVTGGVAGTAVGLCNSSYPSSTRITLTATLLSGTFSGWGGACAGTVGLVCTLVDLTGTPTVTILK